MEEIRIDVLDKGFVTLVDKLGDDLTVINSARVSYGSKKETLDDKDKLLLEYLIMNRHDSPLRHVYLQFRIKAPEFVMRQWYKHVVGINYTERTVDHGWNEISGRYTKYDDFYIPQHFRKQAKDNKQASTDEIPNGDKKLRSICKRHLAITKKLYKSLLDSGVAREQARTVLPVSFYTEIYWTVSLQAVLNFISLRDHPHAQWEIQQYAKVVRELTEKVAPESVRLWDEYRSIS